MTYRKYDPMVKKMIIESGNKNLFPELNIPRTTINYWMKKSKEPLSLVKNIELDEIVKKQDEDLFRLKAKNLFMEECLKKVLIKKQDCFSEKSVKRKKEIIELIEDFKEFLTLKEILEIIELPQSTYYRWRVLTFGCGYKNMEKCLVVTSKSLTAQEQRKLIRYAQASEFKKFSTISLMYYCRRKNLLNISLDSWYKYLKMYGISRKFYRKKVNSYKNGLRAKKQDEIWHIDISHLQYGNGLKAYVQIVIDNYSRLIVGWSLNHKKTINITRKTLRKSLNFTPAFKGKLISDGGSENTGGMAQKILLGKGIKHLIAKSDIKFSNSMVEAVFRQLKQKFLTKKVETYKALYQQLYTFVKQYNEVIPHSSLGGATPIEIYQNNFDRESFKKLIVDQSLFERKKRREEFKKCRKCTKDYFRSVGVWT